MRVASLPPLIAVEKLYRIRQSKTTPRKCNKNKTARGGQTGDPRHKSHSLTAQPEETKMETRQGHCTHTTPPVQLAGGPYLHVAKLFLRRHGALPLHDLNLERTQTKKTSVERRITRKPPTGVSVPCGKRRGRIDWPIETSFAPARPSN